jgi:hypothetical protein
VKSIPVDVLLGEPRYLLHRVDLATERLTFLDTTRRRLAAASFLDGRTTLGEGEAIVVPLSRALEVAPRVAGADRLIAHVSFCGSTLLARLFDVPGRAFSYKEPQALIDLADAQATAVLAGKTDARIAQALDLVLGQLRLQWAGGEATVVKPSNWVNVLLPMLAATSPDLRLVLCDIVPRDFLRAVFRGGRERIVYTLLLASHMQTAFPDRADLMADASRSADPLTNAARLTLVALHLQRRAFDAVDPQAARRLSFRAIVGDPDTSLRRAGTLLGVPLSLDERDATIAANARSHAKSRGAFSFDAHDAADDQIEAEHGARFDAALAWADRALPTPAGQPCWHDDGLIGPRIRHLQL